MTNRMFLALALLGGCAELDPATTDEVQEVTTCGVLAAGAAPEAQAAVTRACSLIGTAYSWGGGHGPSPGPTFGLCDPGNGAPDDCHVKGLDCSGMVRYAYALATGSDVINGTSAAQFQSPRAVARFTAASGTSVLLPGDLVFFGPSAAGIHHVAMYLGGGQIVEAPFSGGHVRLVAMSIHGDYFGAIRLFRDRPAAPVPTDVYAVDQHGGSGHTEVHALAHGSAFASFSLHAATALGPTDASWQLLFGDYNNDGKTDLYAIRKAGGGSDHTEVHVLDGADSYHSFLLHAATALGETGNDGRWQFQLADYNRDGKLDLFAINRQGTGTSSTEVHVLDGANTFASFLLHTGSALAMTDAAWTLQVADYNADGHPDVYAIKSTTSATEVHILDGAHGFDSFLLRKVTALGATASPAWTLRIGQLAAGKPDLFAIKTSDANPTEVHVLDGDSGFQTFSLHKVSALGPVSTTGWAFDVR